MTAIHSGPARFALPVNLYAPSEAQGRVTPEVAEAVVTQLEQVRVKAATVVVRNNAVIATTAKDAPPVSATTLSLLLNRSGMANQQLEAAVARMGAQLDTVDGGPQVGTHA